MFHAKRVPVSIAVAAHLLLTIAFIAPARAGAATMAKCQSRDLAANLVIIGSSNTANGPQTADILLTNMGGTSCSLIGYPGVSAWKGHQVGNAAKWVPAPKPFLVLTPFPYG